MRQNSKYQPTLPKSPTSVPINIIALAISVIVFISIRQVKNLSTLHVAAICFFTLAGSIIMLEFIFLKPYKYASTGLDFSLKRKWDLSRVGIKLLGFYFTLLVVAFAYWLLEEYHGDFYNDFWGFLKITVPPLLIAAIPYFIIIDCFMVDPQDEYWNVGMFVLLHWSKINRDKLKHHVRSWLVKSFYLPLMFTYFVNQVRYFQMVNLSDTMGSFLGFYNFAYNIVFAFDLIFVSVGYSLTMRLFDSHVRSVEPTLLGWLVTLECYNPFWSFFSSTYLKYSNNFYWNHWLSEYPVLYIVWGCLILFFLSIYVYATIPFGLRFSNLTNRGILTNGPYRFCKHPAYVSKNISWWMISVPFISSTEVSESIRLSLLLLCVNIIYFLRARTEERHLSRDPVYIEYAMAMNKNSVFAWIGKLFPIMQFKPHKMFNVRS